MIRAKLLFALLLFAFSCSPCPDCKGQVIDAQAVAAKRWYTASNAEFVDLLYVGPALIGRFSHVTREYQPWENGRWGAPTEAPFPPPPPPRALIKQGKNYGLNLDKLGGEPFAVDGLPATREQVFEALEADIPDDKTKARVTVMGDGDRAAASINALREWYLKRKLEARVLLWSGSEEDAVLRRRGFVGTPNAVAVYVQEPTGKVLKHLRVFDPLRDVEAVEAALYAWDSSLFPDRKPTLPGLPDLSPQTVVMGLLLLAVGGLYFRRPRLA